MWDRVMFMCITKDYSAQTEDTFWETLQTNSLVFFYFDAYWGHAAGEFSGLGYRV